MACRQDLCCLLSSRHRLFDEHNNGRRIYSSSHKERHDDDFDADVICCSHSNHMRWYNTMTGLTGKPGSVGLGLWTMASTSPTRGSSMMLGPGILSDTVILTNFNGDAPYLYHPRSGICATLQPGLSSTGDMQMYDEGSITLEPCGCSDVPAENQAWLSIPRLLNGQCVMAVETVVLFGPVASTLRSTIMATLSA